jgi:molybdopterin converting factor small subunit
MDDNLQLTDLSPDPVEEWQRMLRFCNLDTDEQQAMTRSVEPLMQRSIELVINTYDYLRSVPETAAILGWEDKVDEQHLEERRRFFTIWLARTLGSDTSDEFALYLFRAGQYHAGHGPRSIHTPPAYITISIGMVLAAFANILVDAHLPAETIAYAMAGWSKYLTVQLNQMAMGYSIARHFSSGDFEIHVSLYGKMRPLIGKKQLSVPITEGAQVQDLLKKFFDYYPTARPVVLDRVWQSHEKDDSLWVEVNQAFAPKRGWRILLNGRALGFEKGFDETLQEKDEIAIFPPGR